MWCLPPGNCPACPYGLTFRNCLWMWANICMKTIVSFHTKDENNISSELLSIPFSIFCTVFTRFLYFLIYQEKLCLFFNNFFPWENVFSFITRDYDSLLLSICTTFIQFTHIFWRFNKNFLTFFSQNDILYSSIERTFEYWRKEWSANHVESEVCGRRPSGQYLKYSDTGLFL